MKLKIYILLPFFLLLGACGGGSSGSDDVGNGLITFTIILNANCEGRLNSVDVIFDGRNIATLTPGDSTTIEIRTGQHTIEGIADNGGRFGPIERVLEFSGSTQTLNCSS